MKASKKNRLAFTMVEIMIVIAVLGILVALGVPGWLRSRDKARRDVCINNLRMIENAADQYRIDLNLATATDVDMVWLWPSTSTAKSVSSYINRQLFCPAGGAVEYRGGKNDGSINSGGSASQIEANGVPHCVDTGTGNDFQDGTEFEHSI
jgi:prepilin-type N-terminal cleavage/methylation domain-containing protein